MVVVVVGWWWRKRRRYQLKSETWRGCDKMGGMLHWPCWREAATEKEILMPFFVSVDLSCRSVLPRTIGTKVVNNPFDYSPLWVSSCHWGHCTVFIYFHFAFYILLSFSHAIRLGSLCSGTLSELASHADGSLGQIWIGIESEGKARTAHDRRRFFYPVFKHKESGIAHKGYFIDKSSWINKLISYWRSKRRY